MKVSKLNLSLQGKNVSIFRAKNKTGAFQHKFEFYGNSIKCKNVECFPTSSYFLVDTKSELQEAVLNDITAFNRFAMHVFEIISPSTRESFMDQKYIFSLFLKNKIGLSNHQSVCPP
jgi:hypothetical protein